MDSLDIALQQVYGSDDMSCSSQRRRYEEALAAFRAQYGPGEVWIVRAPGRVNLIGEHTDYNHGFVLPVSLDRDVLLFCRPRNDEVVNLRNIEPEFAPRRFAISLDIPLQPIGDWANYAQGSAQWLHRWHQGPLVGFDGLVVGAPPFGVPRGAGLSSSSAWTVVAAEALVAINDLPLAGTALASACSQAEWYVGTRGGIMDHFCSVLGQRQQALFLDCRPGSDGSYRYEHVPLSSEYALVVVNSGVRHRNTGPHYNRRVAETRIGVRLLQSQYPGITRLRDVQQQPWEEIERWLPEEIHASELRAQGIDPETILDNGVSPQTDSFLVRRRCRHVYSENQRVLQTMVALRAGDLLTVGRLLQEAHASARDDYEISVPEIEMLVKIALEQPGVLGARLTGAGWGGCIVALVQLNRVESFAQRVPPVYQAATGLTAEVFACRSAAGAGLVLRTSV